MTLPPEKLGDRGQRYEVECDGPYGVVGWTDTLEDARLMRDAILTAPSVTEVWITDRQEGGRVD